MSSPFFWKTRCENNGFFVFIYFYKNNDKEEGMSSPFLVESKSDPGRRTARQKTGLSWRDVIASRFKLPKPSGKRDFCLGNGI